ncbi:hypothetical protein OS965_41485, partial [Streptomyces sp. H27-G5]|uniref:hypothetical protein n=1 Tax=Streptomyces sp. H27-G5 TaxID=2996698 RepID=UPI00227163EB
MRRIGALPAVGLDQPGLAAVLEQPVEDCPFQAVPDQPGTELRQRGEVEAGIGQLRAVKSARSAVPAFRPVRFSGPLPAPAVRLSTQRALHKSLGFLE